MQGTPPIETLLAALGAGLNLPLLLALGSVVKSFIDAFIKRYDPPTEALIASAVALSGFVAIASYLMAFGPLTWQGAGMIMRDWIGIFAVATGITLTHNDARERAATMAATAARRARTAPPGSGVPPSATPHAVIIAPPVGRAPAPAEPANPRPYQPDRGLS